MAMLLYVSTVFLVNVPKWSCEEPRINSKNEICTQGYRQCANTTTCRHHTQFCDGNIDCPNGEDEDKCDDQLDDLFWDHYFRKNPAHEIGKGSCYLNYNGSCSCAKNNIYCKNIDSIPSDLPHDIELLDLSSNNFELLNAEFMNAVSHYNISKISLRHCNIRRIDSGTFHNTTRVEILYLDNNGLEKFPCDLFSEENQLRELLVMYNRIENICPHAFKNLQHLIELDLRGNRLTEVGSSLLAPLTELQILHLQNNRISKISNSSFMSLPLIQLSLVNNGIESLPPHTFAKLHQLQFLFLSSNKLKELKNGTFYNLTNLKSLTLDDNQILSIETGVYVDTPNLTMLKLEHNKFRNLEGAVLAPLEHLEHVYFDRFELCSAAMHVKDCNPKGDGISSHGHLLANPILRASVWIMGGIGCTGNLVVLLGRLLAPSNNVVHSLYLRNLAMSDLLMGVYLFIIAGADHHYRGVYLMHQYGWRHSLVCNFCGFLSTLSCESSVMILTLVTWDRFVSVTQPLARRQLSPKMAGFTLLFLWLFAAGIAIAPLDSLSDSYFDSDFYGSNGVCLSLHIHEPYAKGWEYSAMLYIFINSLALIFISYAYLRMIKEIKASGVACRSTRQSQERDKVAQRFGIIVLTDGLCWVPIIIVKIVALSGVAIQEDLYAWLAIFILPINSALNPVLYTLTTTIFKKQMRKIINSCLYKRRQDQQQSASESGFSLSFGVFPIGGSTRRILSYRGTESSLTTSKNSWKRPPTAV